MPLFQIDAARSRKAFALMLSAVLCSGCGSGAGEGKAVVRGRIVQNGSPLEVEGRDVQAGRVEVLLVRPDGFAQERVMADAEGNFEFLGEGDGVAPGTYKIAVKQIEAQPPGPPPAGTRPGPSYPGTGESDKLGGAFDEKNTPIVREIGEGEIDLGEIDLAREKAPL